MVFCDTSPKIASLSGHFIASDALDDHMFASANIGRGDPVRSMMRVFFFLFSFSSSEGEWIHQPRKEEDK